MNNQNCLCDTCHTKREKLLKQVLGPKRFNKLVNGQVAFEDVMAAVKALPKLPFKNN